MEEITIRKKELISIIQNTKTYKNPKVKLEQYTIDALCAVDFVFFAGIEFNDIQNKLIFDLGAGTGRLSLTSAFLQPNYIISIDLDIQALLILMQNVKELQLEKLILPICCDVKYFPIKVQKLCKKYKITTIMNPPFGVQKAKADRSFLKCAMSFSDVIYSIHLANKKVQKFIENFIHKFGWKIDYILPYTMILEREFTFHTQKRKEIKVDIYRFIKKQR
jgi:putative methylase